MPHRQCTEKRIVEGQTVLSRLRFGSLMCFSLLRIFLFFYTFWKPVKSQNCQLPPTHFPGFARALLVQVSSFLFSVNFASPGFYTLLGIVNYPLPAFRGLTSMIEVSLVVESHHGQGTHTIKRGLAPE
jgi:hypothetical protein